MFEKGLMLIGIDSVTMPVPIEMRSGSVLETAGASRSVGVVMAVGLRNPQGAIPKARFPNAQFPKWLLESSDLNIRQNPSLER